jgi:hypothetical protein
MREGITRIHGEVFLLITDSTTRILTRIHEWVFFAFTDYQQHYTDFDTDTRIDVFTNYRLPITNNK